MPFDFDGAIKEAEREGLVQGGDRFKIQEGANRIRLMSVPLPHEGSYKGTRNFKWLCYILDRADGQIKTFFMPHTIFKHIRDLQRSEDYAFEEIPMPYDLTINATHAGTKEVEYGVVAARKNTPVTGAELDALEKKKPIKEVQQAIYSKDSERAIRDVDPTREAPAFDPDETPF